MLKFLYKYTSTYRREISIYNQLNLGLVKEDVDKCLGLKGCWVCTNYMPIGLYSDVFKCYVWYFKYIRIVCIFKNNKLFFKEMKRSIYR